MADDYAVMFENMRDATPEEQECVSNYIKSISTEMKEVVNGEWLEKEVVDNTDEDFVWKIEQWQSARCSICGKYHTTPYMYYFYNYNYCPHCGAKMEKGI